MRRRTCMVVLVVGLGLLPGIGLAADPPSVDLRTWDHLDEAVREPGVGDPVPSAGVAVDLFNGNALLSLPLAHSLPVGSGLSLGFGATYNSNAVRFEIDGATPTKLLRGEGPLGLGWTVHLGRIFKQRRWDSASGSYEWLHYSYEGPDGSLYKFWPNVNKAYPNLQIDHDIGECQPLPDPPGGCNYLFTDDDYTVTDSNGTVHHLDLLKPYPNDHDKEWFTTSITDVYGHTVNISYWSVSEYPAGVVKRIWSSENPDVEIMTEICTESDVLSERCPEKGLIKSVTSTGFRGTRATAMTATFELYYDTVSLSDDSGGDQPMAVPILVEVRLPAVAGTSVGSIFYSYDDPTYGPLLSEITSPTGATTELQYGSWIAGNRGTETRSQVGVTEVRVFPAGNVGASPSYFATSWTREFYLDDCADLETIHNEFATTLPDGRKTLVEFGGHPCGDSSSDLGVLRTVEKAVTFEADGTTALRTMEIGWDSIDEATKDGTKPIAQTSTVTFHDDDGTCPPPRNDVRFLTRKE